MAEVVRVGTAAARCGSRSIPASSATSWTRAASDRGVSLTVVRPEAGRFAVFLIPHTLELVTLWIAPGDRVNLEAAVGKWVERLMPPG